ncbi:MAG: hypothetical protein ABTQ25_07700 [Nitrosomonas ureae]
MNKFKYRIYYEFLGPSPDDPFATKPLTFDQVQDGIDKLSAFLPDRFSKIIENNSLIVTDITCESDQDSISLLNLSVAKLNRVTPGLSLLIEKLNEQ